MYNIFFCHFKTSYLQNPTTTKKQQTVLWNENKHQSIKQRIYKCQGFFFFVCLLFFTLSLLQCQGTFLYNSAGHADAYCHVILLLLPAFSWQSIWDKVNTDQSPALQQRQKRQAKGIVFVKQAEPLTRITETNIWNKELLIYWKITLHQP